MDHLAARHTAAVHNVPGLSEAALAEVVARHLHHEHRVDRALLLRHGVDDHDYRSVCNIGHSEVIQRSCKGDTEVIEGHTNDVQRSHKSLMNIS